ncbi:hypothetical protein BDV19DRAFT_291936 [Aspergillus venezuelensis]
MQSSDTASLPQLSSGHKRTFPFSSNTRHSLKPQAWPTAHQPSISHQRLPSRQAADFHPGILSPSFQLSALNTRRTMATIIPANKTQTDVLDRLVNDQSNPNDCACGWYIYYSSVCHHKYTEFPFRCGAKISAAGKTAFCKTPAPRHLVRDVEFDE